MGGAQSKIENEESVSRCKDRLNFLREVVMERNAFASGRSSYAMALKNTGAVLSDYAQGEADDVNHPYLGGTRYPPLVKQPLPVLTDFHDPPPPPLPPLQRSDTMPVISFTKKSGRKKNNGVILEEEKEDEEDNDGDLNGRKGGKSGPAAAAVDETPSLLLHTLVVPPPPEPKMTSWDNFSGIEQDDDDIIHEEEEEDHNIQLQLIDIKWRGIKSTSVNLIKILAEIDDYFLKAFKSVQEVSEIEATRLHYGSNFANNQGHFGHAGRAMHVTTWNRSFRGAPNGENGNDEEKYETHATVLDKLLAGEKKLYEEVKARELMKLEYQTKVSLLYKLKKQGAATQSVEKTKAAVSHLHTRYIIHSQSLDSTVLEVNDIRDTQLCPRLVALVDGMSNMWDSMCEHHGNQLKVVAYLSYLDVWRLPKETTKHYYERTVQLYYMVKGLHSHFETLLTHQKKYVQAINNWLKLNMLPNESSVKEKISSPPCVQTPPIQSLLHSWLDHLQNLPDELVKSAMSSFVAIIKTLMNHQEEEIKFKERCEETSKKYDEYVMARGPKDERDPGQVTGLDPFAERNFAVETIKKFKDETKAHQKLCVQVREKSLESLKIRLPELFRAMLDYAHVCRDSYQQLRSMVHSQNH